MDTEKKYTEEEMKAMETDEIGPDELTDVAGGRNLKDGTLITEDVIDFYANAFKGSCLNADSVFTSAMTLGFPLVKQDALELAQKRGDNPADTWRSIMKRIINEGGFISQ